MPNLMRLLYNFVATEWNFLIEIFLRMPIRPCNTSVTVADRESKWKPLSLLYRGITICPGSGRAKCRNIEKRILITMSRDVFVVHRVRRSVRRCQTIAKCNCPFTKHARRHLHACIAKNVTFYSITLFYGLRTRKQNETHTFQFAPCALTRRRLKGSLSGFARSIFWKFLRASIRMPNEDEKLKSRPLFSTSLSRS